MEDVKNSCLYVYFTFYISTANVEKELTYKVELESLELFYAARDEMNKIDASELTWPAYSTKVLRLFSIPGIELEKSSYF